MLSKIHSRIQKFIFHPKSFEIIYHENLPYSFRNSRKYSHKFFQELLRYFFSFDFSGLALFEINKIPRWLIVISFEIFPRKFRQKFLTRFLLKFFKIAFNEFSWNYFQNCSTCSFKNSFRKFLRGFLQNFWRNFSKILFFGKFPCFFWNFFRYYFRIFFGLEFFSEISPQIPKISTNFLHIFSKIFS